MATIRPLLPSDYPEVAAMADDAVQKGLLGRPWWETEADVAAEMALAGPAEFVVAVNDDGALLGLAGYRLVPGAEADVYGPLVLDEGHGIGAWLASRVESMARQQGARVFSMLIGLDNGGGAAWARWRGYLPDSEHPESVLTWIYSGQMQPISQEADGLVRAARAEDLERIWSLYHEHFPVGGLTREEWALLLPQSRVITQADRVVGMLRLDEQIGWVHHLCVEAGARRRGLGTKLLVQAVQEFWQRHPKKVGLVVPLDNVAPLTLFRRLGFRRELAVARWQKRDG